jgi:Fur family ferric uptake transcriptional regulator
MRMKTISKDIGKIIGRPITNQRKLLLDLIRKADGHLDADEVYRRAKIINPRISLATVYRNLKLFKELGLIAESNIGDTHSHYERKDTAEHYHLICLGCGKIIEFDSPLIARVTTKIERENNFDITSVQLKMEGYCMKCQRKND